MSDLFDPAPYLRPLRLDVPGLLKLVEQLMARLPLPTSTAMLRAADGLRAAVASLAERWQPQARPGSQAARAIDQAIDNAWSVLYWRLDAFAGLPVAHWPEAERARQLEELLFPE